MGLTKNGIEKTPIEVLPDAVVVKIASGSDHIACLTDFGELYTLGKKKHKYVQTFLWVFYKSLSWLEIPLWNGHVVLIFFFSFS